MLKSSAFLASPVAAANALKHGRVIAVATESSFGLLADAKSEVALRRLHALKPRLGKGIALMLPRAEQLVAWVTEVSPGARRIAERLWPGPLTLVLPAKPQVAHALTLDGTLGVRVPGPSPALAVVRMFDGAVTATSANLAGEPPCCNDHDVSLAFKSSIAAGELQVLPGVAPGGLPSTLVRVDSGAIEIIRHGPVGPRELERLAKARAPIR